MLSIFQTDQRSKNANVLDKWVRERNMKLFATCAVDRRGVQEVFDVGVHF